MSINPISVGQNSSALTVQMQNASKKPEAQEAEQKDPNAQKVSSDTKEIRFDAVKNRFIVNGEEMTLLELIYTVTSEAAARAKENLAVSLQKLDDANKDAKKATEWLTTLNDLTPTGGADSTVDAALVDKAASEFEEQYGFSPFDKYGIDKPDTKDGGYTQTEMDKLTEGAKAYMGTVNNNQQAIQLDVELNTHRSNEANEMLSAVAHSLNQAAMAPMNRM